MKKTLLVAGCLLLVAGSDAQPVSQKIQKAFQQFESDSQLKHAISSLYVIDAVSGQVVFDKNSQIGLAGASTQKIITAATAFELLGKDYRYKTEFGYDGEITNGVLNGNLYFAGSGDPTLGSWRWGVTKDSVLLYKWLNDVKRAGIKRIEGTVLFDWSKFSYQTIPNGWIWQDIGNYYGAGAEVLNWKENQFDITLKSGNEIGSQVKVVNPELDVVNQLTAAKKGTGDNAYFYLPITPKESLISGTIPEGESDFKISAADHDPINTLIKDLGWFLTLHSINTEPGEGHYSEMLNSVFEKKLKIFSTYLSPPLDSIIYWFLKKSINLYGEALVKTFAYKKNGFGSTDSGVAIVRDFWKQKGIDEDELNMYDGSGLSPLNRITTHAQAEVLKYAKTKDWFPSFFDALPEYNGMKMKSGTISDVKGFCGYQTAKDGKEYIFSFLVNNYNGRSSELVNKMYKVLDELK